MIEVGEKFEIVMRRQDNRRLVKMQVECIYVSEQVIRFKITGGHKEMQMEKLLLKKRHPWKITHMNFKFEGDDESVALAIMNIQDAIEKHINPRAKPNWYKP